MSHTKDRENFIARMASAYNVPAEVSRLVLRNAATHKRMAVDSCNGIHGGEKEIEAFDRKYERLEERIAKILEPYSITPVFQGDPRGITVKLQVPDGYTDDWGGDGMCVPQPYI